MTYQIAEKFKSVQGEGVYAGTPMAFIRFVGCSVGKTKCQHCDTDFDKTYPWRGGGEFSAEQLMRWSFPYDHICLTGGEPLDQNLDDLIKSISWADKLSRVMVHIETSGTKELHPLIRMLEMRNVKRWICVSPKPGFLEDAITDADEVKVIYSGLGNGEGWPTLEDAKRWAAKGKTVFLQPRNGKLEVNKMNLKYVLDILRDNSELRLSMQLHKLLGEQ